jgi:hypothetical protein
MAKSKLSDAEAKDILRKWPGRSKRLWAVWGRHGFWLRAQPIDKASTIKSPRIEVPGSELFATQPDGMYVFLEQPKFADVVAIEVCGNISNFNDKRSRYSASVRSLVLSCPLPWLEAEISIQKGRRAPRWKASRLFTAGPTENLSLPVRYLRVLYALPKDLYANWLKNNVPGGHEYVCPHSSLDSYNSQKMQTFLRQLSFAAHFYARSNA